MKTRSPYDPSIASIIVGWTMVLAFVSFFGYGFWWKYGDGHEERYAQYVADAKAEAKHNIEEFRKQRAAEIIAAKVNNQ